MFSRKIDSVGKRPTEADISSVMAELGRRGAAAKNGAMKPEERRALAKKAAAARWNGTPDERTTHLNGSDEPNSNTEPASQKQRKNP